MDLIDLLRLGHPVLAVTLALPLVGITIYYAWQTRQRRLDTLQGEKSRIPPIVGSEHMKLGRILTNTVVAICLLGLLHPIVKTLIKQEFWTTDPWKGVGIAFLFLFTIVSLVFLNRVKPNLRIWRGIFTSLTTMGVIVLGCQEGVFRRTNEWYGSHFYSGITVTILMIISLSMLSDIYDRSNYWRKVHLILNSFAFMLFIYQGMTGARDLLEIPLSWQEPYLYRCDFVQKTCLDQAIPQDYSDPS